MHAKCRMVSGENLWNSKKLRQVAPKWRGEYANWIPLADQNGVLELDAENIHGDVYAKTRPEITVEDVQAILEDFIRVGLIQVFAEKWGYWYNIENWLPAPKERERMADSGYPPPPETYVWGEDAMDVYQRIEEICRQKGCEVEISYKLKKDIKKKLKGTPTTSPLQKQVDVLVRSFETFTEQNDISKLDNPIAFWLKVADKIVKENTTANIVNTDEVNTLAAELLSLGDQAFAGQVRVGLGLLLKEFTADQLKQAYVDFLATRDNFNVKFAPRDFVTGAARDHIASAKQRVIDQKKLDEAIKRSAARGARKEKELQSQIDAPKEDEVE